MRVSIKLIIIIPFLRLPLISTLLLSQFQSLWISYFIFGTLYSTDLSHFIWSGIGLGIVEYLAKRQAVVYMVCRNEEKGLIQRDRIVQETANEHVYLLIADCGLEADVRRLWSEFVSHRQSVASTVSLTALICNAGSLTNNIQLTAEGVESTIATHLIFGTFLLVNLALSTLQSTAGSRVIVVSSGGMYNTKFPSWDLATSKVGKYDGQLCYAYAKRGQVLCCEQWTKMHANVKFVSCHPGWVDTGGVDAAFGDKKSYLQPLRSNDKCCF